MRYVLKDNATQQWLGTPADQAPTPAAGQSVVEVPDTFPDACGWTVKAGPGGSLIGGFSDVSPPAPLSIGRFKLLLTQPERIAIRQAAATNALVEDFLDLLDGFTDGVSLADPSMVAAIGQLQAASLLTADRAAAVLAGTPPA